MVLSMSLHRVKKVDRLGRRARVQVLKKKKSFRWISSIQVVAIRQELADPINNKMSESKTTLSSLKGKVLYKISLLNKACLICRVYCSILGLTTPQCNSSIRRKELCRLICITCTILLYPWRILGPAKSIINAYPMKRIIDAMKLSIKSKRYPAKNCHNATIAHFSDLCQKIIQDESGKQTKMNFQKQASLNIDSNVQIFIGDVSNVQFIKSYFLAIPGQRL